MRPVALACLGLLGCLGGLAAAPAARAQTPPAAAPAPARPPGPAEPETPAQPAAARTDGKAGAEKTGAEKPAGDLRAGAEKTGTAPRVRRRPTYAACNRAAQRRSLRGGARRRFLIRCRLGYERIQPGQPVRARP
ncbi:hypothetical protein OPKNFCMD_6060 [Methylobacterium crusticola]|uniref:Serine/threonine protein kinase n=1 Tax=Methylobacterium crusticola TaxID=1697972 RepID=A0ABQ4R7Z9_9HYPH|nr:hypothetical protein [Methylobacterium crusticola]GJD53285.1 hypothetical protein OPKNFCMD_6060 [Methylobacterium crusticola]